MRSVLLSTIGRAFAHLIAIGGVPTERDYDRGAAAAIRQRFGKNLPDRPSDASEDPYFGIKSKGRTGARQRAALMAEAHAGTYIGRRNVRGRDLSWIGRGRRRSAA